ncbi:MAG: 5-methyltetrahydropteroyltriglutamate--homocysteine S-methyltransferase [Anaerolineales bacterium]|nr:5-methyltetrahydropteroyltriglutamate--homocysteine S-methyltransferase [Anaerolineales bacterium]MCW5856511.1 5-methyltetrahydropteroyltriglutamate--homocysteine S-methyltransferase [Anaerolineales bacterium]
MTLTANLGYPRFGAKRELKTTLESFWKGKLDEAGFLAACADLRRQNWQLQQAAGIDFIPSNDFSPYDQVLDTAAMVGAVPARYQWTGEQVSLQTYFAMARGGKTAGGDVPAMEMTKWFDSNYHYIVPEFEPEQKFKLTHNKALAEFKEALDLGIRTRPVLLGPVSFLGLGKSTAEGGDPLDLLPALLPVYQAILGLLAEAGAEWVQIDEPCLAQDLSEKQAAGYQAAYAELVAPAHPKLMLTTYFEGLRDNLDLAVSLGAAGLHIDLVRAPEQLEPTLAALPAESWLSVGVVDGRNVWRTDLDTALAKVKQAAEALGPQRVLIAPSCSLLFSPYDLDLETKLDAELRSWLAFAKQKIAELATLKQALESGSDEGLLESRKALEGRAKSARTHDPAVRQRMAAITPTMLQRQQPHAQRKAVQDGSFGLPPFPTTTIGSFPQTKEVRAKRAAFRKGEISKEQYEDFLREETKRTIRFQEEIGLDVLVHGEFERTDMVEYFGEQLQGFAFTQHGWVQSYGSRGVRPPIIYGDVTRPQAMTVDWSVFAQSLTNKPMKGMLTGPVTILQWSFVRNDQPRAETCQQIALAIRDEVQDLEANGIRIIQIDEPAFREGMPLRREDWAAYLKWAVDAFLLASTGVQDETQIHTHMCYAEFNDIFDAIAHMDADVISIEASRSKMELLDAFERYAYHNDIGPGVYDIHSPLVPNQADMQSLLENALKVIRREQLWVNPDCGLKTRGWAEVEPALRGMVAAARALRAKLG